MKCIIQVNLHCIIKIRYLKRTLKEHFQLYSFQLDCSKRFRNLNNIQLTLSVRLGKSIIESIPLSEKILERAKMLDTSY